MSLAPQEKAVAARIQPQRDAMLATLAEHVAIPTGRGHRPGLEEYRGRLRAWLEDLGADVELREGQSRPAWLETARPRAAEAPAPPPPPVLVARRPSNSPGKPRVLIAGHLDTVHDPEGEFQTLDVAPDGRTATGPGAADMKGGILLALTALEALELEGVDLHWTVLLNADEETGSFTSEAVLREISREHDVGLAVEPALPDGSLAVERMGSGQFRVAVRGRGAHVGREFEKGVSAVTRLGEVLVRLGEMARPDEGRIVSAGPLLGGEVTNAVPDFAACWGNLRYRDPAVGGAILRDLDALATEGDALPRVRVDRHLNRPAKPETDAVRRLAETARAAAEDLGQTLPFAKTGGVCDGNIMQDAGLPTIDTLGVRGGNLHRTDEFIEVPSLVERAQLFAVLLMRLASPSRG